MSDGRGRSGTHFMSQTPTYRSWERMKERCNNASHPRFHRYGGRNIKVCERWLSFSNFLEDMGTRPDGKNLDRIDGDGDYQPDNCKWSTPQEQNKNRCNNVHIEFKGVIALADEWSEVCGVNAQTIRGRLKRGWSAEDALTKPPLARGRNGINSI